MPVSMVAFMLWTPVHGQTGNSAPQAGASTTNAPSLGMSVEGSPADVLNSSGNSVSSQSSISSTARTEVGKSTLETNTKNATIATHAPRSEYDIAAAVADSLGSSTEVSIDQRNIAIDNRKVDEVAASERPLISASAGATRYDQATKVSFGPQSVQVLGTHSEILNLNVSNKIDISGQIRAAKTQAQLQVLSDKFQLKFAKDRRVLETKQAYYALLRSEHEQNVARAALTASTQQQLIAQKLFDQHVGQKIDLLRANAQVASATQEVISADSEHTIARNNFNNFVGNPLAWVVNLSDSDGQTFNYLDGLPNAPVGELPKQTTTTLNSPVLPALMPLQSYIDVAKSERADLAIALLNVRIAETGITLARSSLSPSLSIGATGDYFPTTSFQSPRQRVAALTATLTLPLYDGGATRDRISEAQLRKQNAQDLAESKKSDIEVEVSQAYTNVVTAGEQILSANTQLEEALAARQLAQVRYENQVGLYLEVSNAQSSLEQAEANHLNALYDYHIAQAQLDDAIGNPSVTQ